MDKHKTDLCILCKHFWKDFPMPLDRCISHCEISDIINGFKPLDETVPYPCEECPFNSFDPLNVKFTDTNYD